MKNSKSIISILLISLIIISNALPNLKNEKAKAKKMNSKAKLGNKKFLEKPKEYYDDLIEKGLIADNLTAGSPPPESYKPINYKIDKVKRKEILQSFKKKANNRKLSETQTLEDLGFIDIYQNASYAMRFLMSNVKKEESKFILYPYPFNYKDKEEETHSVNNGGFFHLNQSQLTGQKFSYIQNITSATIGKAKGIYDIDIGIMSLTYQFNGNEIDLFTEASTYCDYFVSTLNKLSSCLVGKEKYLEYKNNYPNKGAVVRINHEDLLNNILFDPETNQLKIKLLIFSDYLSDNDQTIFDKYLKQDQLEIIKKFRNLGGHILVSGKSGYLLEKVGFIPENTYDTSFTLMTKNPYKGSENRNKISGCQDIYKNSPEEQNDFFKQLICMGYLEQTYLSRTFTLNQVPEDFDSLVKYTNQNKFLQKIQNGEEIKIDDETATFDYILVSKEDQEKGRIMIVNGNPIQSTYYFIHERNFILYAMCKNFIYDLKIKFSSNSEEDLPIPAGEEGVQLVTSFKILNLDIIDMKDVEVNILFAKDVELISENGCSFITNDPNKYKDLNDSSIETSKYLKCTSDTILKLNKLEKDFKLEITSYKVTQKLVDIPLIYSKITYKLNEKEYINTPGIFYAQAEAAALLRGTINKDPTSYWPMNGWGVYFDLVLAVENKENTIAKDVNFISIIPLVCPLMDGSDQNGVAQIIPLYENYYEKYNYDFPWKSIDKRGTDYIDYLEVAGKEVCYVADFDTPVKLRRIPRGDVTIENKYIPQNDDKPDDYADKTKAGSPNTLLKQVYFGDNEAFYETADARTSLFINTAKEKGAQARYGNDIPDDLKDPHNNNRAKAQYAFIRVDTYFYTTDQEQYQLPNGFDNKILISIDKFNQDAYPPQENKKLGDIRKQLVNQGHYDSTKNNGDKLKPNEWANTLRQYDFLTQYDPTNPEMLERLKEKTTDIIRLSHYLMPFSNPDIEKAGSLYGFHENDDGSGYLEEYPSVKFIYGHSINLVLNPNNTRLGGKAEIYLGAIKFNDENEEEVINNERVTTSADNVAFYKTEYNSEENKVILYFKRGLMPNENYGQASKCQVYLENLNIKTNFTLKIEIYSLKYDFSKYNLESLTKEMTLENELAQYIPFFSYPCLYIENKLKRKPTFTEEYSYDMREYELINTYARYGGYYQELTKHTSVYASAEAHHVTNPGFQSTSHGFTLIGNIGTSPIPFAEFLEHGELAVPGVVSTSRLEWTDIWGRKWGQNLRSVYPDIPPIPPAPLSFIMTTTYELITNDKKQERVLEWQSDESVYIRIQMKMKNTYKLYWEPTFCLANQKPFIKTLANEYRNPTFVTPEEIEDLSGVNEEHDINLGFNATYGVCYPEGSYIEGQKINKIIANEMWKMMSCSSEANAEEMTQCSNRAKELNLPKVVRKPDNVTVNEKQWNYSPLIEEYLPDGYIHSDMMWQLNMEPDYWDDSFYKGYPWHLDDCIPNLDNSITKPHDLIAFPIYKGLGYNITYDNSYSLRNYSRYKGWWSDQLQNKDHTLLAGQQNVNAYSVGKDSLISNSKWINGKDLKYSPKTHNVALNRMKNIYVCQYNQHRVKVKPYQKKYAFLKNVYQNNVVPVLPDLTEKDPRYSSFDCSGENSYQYTPYNISKVNNRVNTGNDRDWLYFAAGLRGNAKENINVILKMDPIKGTYFEGITKVQDGGRFTYWQPPDGPNSYGYFDGNVNTVISKRVDLFLTHKMIPTEFFTFNFNTYQLFSIADRKEDKREFTMTIYTNSHGYGDSTTTIYVGGVNSTKCRVEPTEYTIIKIVFYNNAGFDWIMKKDAIEFTDVIREERLNAMSIMQNVNTAIQHPTKYNFMTPEIPQEIAPYITLTPSDHVSDVSPQFYDLTFNNVLNIKDALEGDYFYRLEVKPDFPNILKGKLWEIPIKLNKNCFESLPNHNDPTGIHSYDLTIPSIKFGVPISEGVYKGKIFYNLGQAKDIKFTYQIHKSFIFKGIKIVTEEDIDQLSEVTNRDKSEIADNLNSLWNNIAGSPDIERKIRVTNYTLNDFYQEVTVDLSEAYPSFPYEQSQAPFVTNISILVKTFSGFIPYGYKNHLILSNVSYNDYRKTKNTYADYPLYINCYSKGPSIRPSYSSKIVEFDKETSKYIELPEANQTIHEGDTHTIKLTIKVTNEGTSGIFYPVFKLGLDPNANVLPNENSNNFEYVDNGIKGDIKELSISFDGSIESNEYKKFDLYIEMKFEEKNILRNLENSEKGSFSLVKSLKVELCLQNNKCDENSAYFGIQDTEKSYKINYVKVEKEENADDKNEENANDKKEENADDKNEKNADDKNEETESDEKKGIQAYIIAIIIVVSFLIILGGGFIIYRYVFAKKDQPIEEEVINEKGIKTIEEENNGKKIDSQFNPISSSTKRSISNKRNENIIPFEE